MGHYTASMKRVREIARTMEGCMGWTRERPKEAGWYWCRGYNNASVGLVRLWWRGDLLVGAIAGEAGYYMPESIGTEWQGPIRPEP